jgi:hypothetical protein
MARLPRLNAGFAKRTCAGGVSLAGELVPGERGSLAGRRESASALALAVIACALGRNLPVRTSGQKEERRARPNRIGQFMSLIP